MTKRAKHIVMFVDTLTDLVSNAMFIRTHAFKPRDDTAESQAKHQEAKNYLTKTEMKLKACLAEICENNEEQAEALMMDMGIKWVKPPAETTPETDGETNG